MQFGHENVSNQWKYIADLIQLKLTVAHIIKTKSLSVAEDILEYYWKQHYLMQFWSRRN